MYLNYFGKRKKINFNLPAITIRAKEKNQKKIISIYSLRIQRKTKNKILAVPYICINHGQYLGVLTGENTCIIQKKVRKLRGNL